MADFDVRQRTDGRVVVVELAGRLDSEATAAMQDLHGVVDRPGTDALLLDFTAVDYINSTGIALIVALAAKAWTTGRPVHACGLTDHYRHIFDITRISDFVKIHGDQAAALAAAGDDGPRLQPTEPVG